MREQADFHFWRKLYNNMKNLSGKQLIGLPYSDLDSADIANSKFIAKSPVATSAILDINKIVLEVKCRGRSFEVNQSVIDANATFWFLV